MISKNLFYLNSFLQEPDIQFLVGLVTKLCPAEELDHEYSRAVNRSDIENYEIIMTLSPEVLKRISSEEKVLLYEILRLFSLTDNSWWKYIFHDYNEMLRKRGYLHERYLYLNSMNDNFFAYQLDCTLTKDTDSRRNFYRRFNSKFLRNTLTLEELLLKYFRISVKVIKRKIPKRKEYHKGYRDHGSLGTGDRKLVRDIQTDVWIQKEEKERRKRSQDFLRILRGLDGRSQF